MMIATLSLPLLPSPPSIPTPNPRLRPRAGGSNTSWGSNAEDVGSGRFGFRDDRGFREKEKNRRRWWSDDLEEEEDEEYFDEDEEEEEEDGWWDKFWIFKVFKSYGYFLPAIVASMLIATGPKAFLMAMALPLGQSALSLAYESLWGKERQRPASRSKTKRRPFYRSYNDFMEEEEDEEEKSARANEARQNYQSWATAGSVREQPRTSSFGGWDDLDKNRGSKAGSRWQKRARRTAGSVTGAQSMKAGRMSRRRQRKDTPLFLRLLIAVFPFLESWTWFL